ncbi:GNAT family N-acetyltransferase [Streptomyces sp. NPDC058611]|uniref:GNAT family N-acetyltransferase n=1 Tax=unclassified Streptomyces TaxID=2593676 RepID=UPI0036663BE3
MGPGELGLDRLLIEVDEANAASLRVAVKCGFERVAAGTGPDAENGRRTPAVFVRRAPRR